MIPSPPPSLFSQTHGFYDQPFELVLTAPEPGDEIRYTLDGRDPAGETARVYEGPLAITTTTVVSVSIWHDGKPLLPARTQTYLFARDIPQQRAPDEYPTQWWVEDDNGPYTADYEMDPEVVFDPLHLDRFPAAFYELPVVSVVMDPTQLFGHDGIHENSLEHGVEWERPASAEIFSAGTAGKPATEGIQVNCGIRIQGGSGRMPERSPKKSFRLLFKEMYGPSKLGYPVFADELVQKFDTLVLRAHYNRSWAHYVAGQRNRAQYIRERFASDTQRAMGHVSPHGEQVHLFLNGLYWGIYLLQERPDASFQAQHFGGEKEEYDAINAGTAIDGDRVAWDEMMALARSGLESAESYLVMAQWLDIDNFIDYMLLNLYLGNVDWPDRNWYAARHRSPEGRFRFFNWDAELTIRNLDDNFIGVDFADTPGELFQLLRVNPVFRLRFSERVILHTTGTGALSPDVLIARWNELADKLAPAVVAESARWGDHYRDVRADPTADLYTYDTHWLAERTRITGSYLPRRRDIVLQQLAEAGLYVDPSSREP